MNKPLLKISACPLKFFIVIRIIAEISKITRNLNKMKFILLSLMVVLPWTQKKFIKSLTKPLKNTKFAKKAL